MEITLSSESTGIRDYFSEESVVGYRLKPNTNIIHNSTSPNVPL